MEQNSETEKIKDKEVVRNGTDVDLLQRDEAFWQRTVITLAKVQISEKVEKFCENDNKTLLEHSEKVFCVNCKCGKCMIFRKVIVGIHVENQAYNDLWEKLKEILSSYYTMLPTENDPIFQQEYEKLHTESCGIRWFSDGSIDVKRNNVSMGNYFSLSNEMTFIIVFNMLILRDQHQLFELLCLQLTSIILAYREGIKARTKVVDDDKEYYKPEEFLNYILNGYDRITEIAETLTPLVIEMRDHLQKFSLTWQLINQTMYYRFLYVDIESRMADCILRLKDVVDAETYKNFVYRFIKFDEEMTQIGQVWEVALAALDLYRKSTPEQVARVERIGLISQIFNSLRDLKEVPTGATIDEQALSDWTVSSENDDVWHGVLNIVKNELHCKDRTKLTCNCWTCSMADGSTVPEICAVPTNSLSEVKNKPADECYHLAWAVFKHLKDREVYNKHCFTPEIFCVFKDPPCQLMECQVATNLLIGSYPLSFTRFLLRTYQPLSTSDREKFLKVPSQSLIRKFCLKKGGAAAKEIMQEAEEINHSFLLLNMFWDDDDIADPVLRAGLAAALAENFKFDVKFPHKNNIISYFYALFRKGPTDDIVMDLEWLEKVNLANLFKSFGVISNTIHESANLNNASNTVEAIEMTLNELKITAEVSGSSSNALDLVQFSMKEVAEKLSAISLTDENSENAKQVLENEIKRPLVEALKLAASNKKLEAELKSLQKEHNMLKDMVKGLEQIHGDKKEVQVTVTTATKSITTESHAIKCSGRASPSTSPSTSELDHSKDTGNSSDCVCYYCTLFGKNQDLMNSRSTETRDRLRKRLHQLQSQKDFSGKSKNLKNISLLLKNGAAASATSTTSQKPMKCTDTTPHKCTNGVTPNGASMKMKVELELQRKKKANPPKPSYSNKPEVKIQRATEINLKSLENLVEYIEGPSSKAVVEQKKAEEAAAKKQQKKAKQMEQKVRRQVESHLESLQKLNDELHEVVIDTKQLQNQLSQLKAGKGKTKELKKVRTAEEKFSEFKALKSKLESEAKNLLCSIKDLNPTINLFQECLEMKAVMTLLGSPPPTMTQPPPKVIAAPVPIPRPVPIPVKVQHQPPQPPKSSEEDPAKRMVTIRRINLPHAEPQVTVTAKGSTPDMDQLLYTFVNGQLVPASSLSPSAFQNGSIQLFMSSNGQTKMVVGNNQQQQQELSKTQVNDKSKKKQTLTPPVADKTTEKVKKESKKKKEEQSQSVVTAKKELKKAEPAKPHLEAKKPVKNLAKKEVNAEKKKKTKKAYIDPEFAANPFKLLDDEQHSESDEEFPENLSEMTENIKKIEDQAKPNPGKLKEDKKAVKKQPKVQTVQPAKGEKNGQKKNQQSGPSKGKSERKDSSTSVTSSNASKETKSKPKQKIVAQDNVFKLSDLGKKTPAAAQLNSNSIMDQLNRGVRVEGLRLPPGITLTKVAPSDSLGLKRESMNRIVQPMQDYASSSQPEQIMSHDPNGIIMVESNPHAMKSQANVRTENVAGKKKNKKKKSKSEAVENSSQVNQEQASPDRIVTIKNPMFYNNASEPMNSMMRNLQTPPFVSPLAEPPVASIIRNENGMYTIRNPSFQGAFGGTPAQAFSPRPQVEPQVVGNQFSQSQFSSFDGEVTPNASSVPKCSSVIGSEMKNVLQRRKEQEFAATIDPYHQFGMRPQSSTYSHFGGSGVNFSNNGTISDDNFMPQTSSSAFQPYSSSLITNYDDLRLQPGKMLNSEVTIHNITESKMFQNQAKKNPLPIGKPRNGNMEAVGTLFGDLLISRPMAPSDMPNGNDQAIRGDSEPSFKRFDFNNTPPKQPLKNNLNETHKKTHAIALGDDFDKIQNSTNSNSPISVTSLDDIYESGDQKIGNLPQKTPFYSSLHNFSDEKSSGASSLFSSGM